MTTLVSPTHDNTQTHKVQYVYHFEVCHPKKEKNQNLKIKNHKAKNGNGLVVLAGISPGISRQSWKEVWTPLHVSFHDRFLNESQTHLSTVHLTLITLRGLSTTLVC